MLKRISPLISPELLKMGHGDYIVFNASSGLIHRH